MNLRARVYVERQKKDVENKLAVRLAALKEKGVGAEKIQRDATARRLRAELKKANTRLARIGAQEKLNQERAQTKAQKIAAQKAEREAALKGASEEPAGKKEKKGKKEKPEKETKPEKKKEKKEKKTEAAPENK